MVHFPEQKAYSIIFEYGHTNPFPRYFDPVPLSLAWADTLSEARDNIRSVCGTTRLANLECEQHENVAERRRNHWVIATVIGL